MFEDHAFEQRFDYLLLFGRELADGFKLEAEIAIRTALIGAKDQHICTHLQSHREPSNHVQSRLRGSALNNGGPESHAEKMFTDKDQNFVKVELDTTLCLGRKHIGEEFFDLLFRYEGIYLPERWDTEDRGRLRRSFDRSCLPEFIEEWTRAEEWKTLFFTRKRPSPIELSVDIQRHRRAKFNEFSAYIQESHFNSTAQEKELLNFTIDMSLITRADYGLIAHKKQERRHSPVLTPAERLPGIYWANFFGRPYIEFFGREKLLATPCYEVREINNDLILLLTAESLNAPEMISSDEVVNQVKAYLNQNAFAGPNFPDEPCAVPEFNFGDVRWSAEPPVEESSDEKLARLRTDLQAKGYKLIEEKDGRLIFRGEDKSVVIVDRDKAEVSVHLTRKLVESGLDYDHQ